MGHAQLERDIAVGKATAIIVAAGSSTRMGFDKIFVKLVGKPVLAYSLVAFNEANRINEIIVVVSENNVKKARDLAVGLGVKCRVVKGGANRSESVQKGLDCVRENECGTEIIAIHDGARPLITPVLIDKLVAQANVHRAVVPGFPARDTIKFVDESGVSTPPRDKLYAVQTPQVFELALYKEAVQKLAALQKKSEVIVTDDAMIVELATVVSPKIVEGDYSNIKITTPEDLLLAKALLKV
ncbi:MAG: 2-C-methyl-D-erythritol 4-phosphate cytidylyltransferase [Oscillospiraceae bacterium]|nr:2-C-methyl-D-erythritol 4-phosphate cytidylyltransferase [Oscillospiraceae bacterium]